MNYDRAERERLRLEYTKAWRAMRMIRAALEEHAPEGTIPEQEFLTDFPQEAAVLVTALRRALTQGAEMQGARA